MKILYLFYLLGLLASIHAKKCKKRLMESFDLDGFDQTFSYQNTLCNSIAQGNNCCSYLN